MADRLRKNDGLSWSFIKTYTPADDTDAGVQGRIRSFIPDVTGTVAIRFASGGTAYLIPVVAGGWYPIRNIYSFDAANTDATSIAIFE